VDERTEQQVDGEERELDDQHRRVPELGQSHFVVCTALARTLLTTSSLVRGYGSDDRRATFVLASAVATATRARREAPRSVRRTPRTTRLIITRVFTLRTIKMENSMRPDGLIRW